MENLNIDSLRGFLASSILEWLTEDKPSTSRLCGSYANTDEIFKSLPEAELVEWEHGSLKSVIDPSVSWSVQYWKSPPQS